MSSNVTVGFASSQQATLTLFIPLCSWYISAIERETHFSLDNTSSLLFPKVHMKFAMLHKNVFNTSATCFSAWYYFLHFVTLTISFCPLPFQTPLLLTQGHSWYIMNTLKNKNIYCSIDCPRNFS